MRLVYLGSPEVAVGPLRRLVAAGHEVLLVVSQQDKKRGRGGALSPSPVKRAAIELGLPVSDRLADVVAAVDLGAQLGVVVAYGRLIRPDLLDIVPFVNLHFSLLPRWRGAAPVERAILAGDSETGVCLMRLERTLDTGPVYRRTATSIGPAESASSLRSRLSVIGAQMLEEAISGGLVGLGEPVDQVGEPTYAAKLDPAQFAVRWAEPAEAIARLVRIELAWTTFRGRRLKLIEAAAVLDRGVDTMAATSQIGELSRHGPEVWVRTGAGFLRLVAVQPDGRSAMNAVQWWHGVRPQRAERLENQSERTIE